MSDKYVLELLEWAKENHGFTGLPCGGSGSGTKDPRPDFVLMRERPSHVGSYRSELLLWAGEHKKTKANAARFNRKDSNPHEIHELVEFCRNTPFVPLLAARFTRDMNHYLLPVGHDYLRETDGGEIKFDQPDTAETFPGWVLSRESLLYPLSRNDVTNGDREKSPDTIE